MDVNVPTKIVLPPISPLFATGERMFQPVQVHPLPHVAIPSLRTPTNNQAILSFNRAFAMSSPVQKEANKTNNLSMYKNVSALESFKLDRSFPSGFVSSTTDNEDLVSGNDGTVQDNGKKTRMNRERNRLHAQRTRSRKRELLENLKESISMLEHEYQLLKHVYESHVTAVCLLSLGGNWIQGLDEMMDVVNDHGSVKDVKAVDFCSTFGVDEINSCLDDGSLIGDCTGTTSSVVCSKEEREQCRRERNRLHARRARLRKKLLLEKNQKEVTFLRARNENLRSRLRMLVAMIYEDQSSFVPIRMA